MGLPNLGNTCFVNAVVQMLSAAPVMHEHLTAHPVCVDQKGAYCKSHQPLFPITELHAVGLSGAVADVS